MSSRNAPSLQWKELRYAHLLRMTDSVGLAEHCRGTEPRWELGYCVDDVARALVVLTRDPAPTGEAPALADLYRRFLLDAVTQDGLVHNRRAWQGGWTDEPSWDDCWGRCLWALGTVISRGTDPSGQSLRAFDVAARRRSPHLRSMGYAGLGAAEVLDRYPRHRVARELLTDAATCIDEPVTTPDWPWPEPRLRYANAVLPETLLAAGTVLREATWRRRGLDLLGWLVDVETASVDRSGHLSPTPVAGWTMGDPRPGFDQQPIEAGAIAEACARAWSVTGDPRWRAGVLLAAAWFEGRNDLGVSLVDPVSGGCHDGLTPDGRNGNQGAESTLAFLRARQLADMVDRSSQ